MKGGAHERLPSCSQSLLKRCKQTWFLAGFLTIRTEVCQLGGTMEPIIVESKESQLKIFRALHERMKKRFADHEPDNEYYLRGYKGSEDLAKFGLDIWIGQKWLGIDLWGPPIDGTPDNKNVLGFATYSAKSGIGRTAAALARDAGGIALYHDGRVFTRDGRARPHGSDPMVKINGRLYHRIAYIEDPDFFDRVVDYHFSRLNPDLASNGGRTGKKGSGLDAGPAKGGVRSSAVFTARHNPLTAALWEQVEDLGYTLRTCEGVTPDLLVEKNGKSALFEVKPVARTHDLILACGQVLVYNEHAKADRIVIVSERPNFSKYAGKGIARVLKKFDIAFIPYRKTKNGYIFKGLEQIIRGQD